MRRATGHAAVLTFALLANTAARAEQPDVYILAGQSNMSGRGELSELTSKELKADRSISLYGNDGKIRAAAEPLDANVDQVDRVSFDKAPGVGPGLFFARTMLNGNKRPILLVPCARGGTSIGRWKPDGGRETLYGSCLARAREAGGRIAGLLWYQGESDAGSEERAQAWGSQFAELAGAFRRDLDAPKLPIVFVQIADRVLPKEVAQSNPAWETVQAVQADVRLPCTKMVKAAGLPLAKDDLHLTTAAQRRLGPQMATAMLALQRNGCR